MRVNAVPFYSALHFHIIKNWWEKRKCGVPDPGFLPPTGLVIYSGGEPICAGFLFKTDARIGVINHIVSNPEDTDSGLRDEALSFLIAKLIQEARMSGLRMVTASCNMKKLQERYERWGFTKTDTDEVHFGRLI